MWAVRTAMRLARTNPKNAAEGPTLDQLARLHYRRSEHFRLRIPMHCAGSSRGIKHGLCLCRGSAQGLRANLIFSRLRQFNRYRQMYLVRQRDDVQVQVASSNKRIHICTRFRNGPAARKIGSTCGISRVVNNDFGPCDILKSLHVEIGHKARSQQGDTNTFSHTDVLRFFGTPRKTARAGLQQPYFQETDDSAGARACSPKPIAVPLPRTSAC